MIPVELGVSNKRRVTLYGKKIREFSFCFCWRLRVDYKSMLVINNCDVTLLDLIFNNFEGQMIPKWIDSLDNLELKLRKAKLRGIIPSVSCRICPIFKLLTLEVILMWFQIALSGFLTFLLWDTSIWHKLIWFEQLIGNHQWAKNHFFNRASLKLQSTSWSRSQTLLPGELFCSCESLQSSRKSFELFNSLLGV